jgi:hypothetical protein
MAEIAGVTIKNDAKGNLAEVRINTKINPDAIGKLKSVGLIEQTPFEKKFEEAADVDEVFERLIKHIDDTWEAK